MSSAHSPYAATQRPSGETERFTDRHGFIIRVLVTFPCCHRRDQRFWTGGDESSQWCGIATGNECDVMSVREECLRQQIHDLFNSAFVGDHRMPQRREK